MGRHSWTTRGTVEDCAIRLPVHVITPSGIAEATPEATNTFTWTDSASGAALGHVEFRLIHPAASGLAVFIRRQYTRLLNRLTLIDEQCIPLRTVRPFLGGTRYWFECGCERRVGNLYLPEGQQVFRCRFCYNLTYRSTQTHDQRKAKLSRNIGAIRAMMHSKSVRQRVQGIAIFAIRLRRTLR